MGLLGRGTPHRKLDRAGLAYLDTELRNEVMAAMDVVAYDDRDGAPPDETARQRRAREKNVADARQRMRELTTVWRRVREVRRANDPAARADLGELDWAAEYAQHRDTRLAAYVDAQVLARTDMLFTMRKRRDELARALEATGDPVAFIDARYATLAVVRWEQEIARLMEKMPDDDARARTMQRVRAMQRLRRTLHSEWTKANAGVVRAYERAVADLESARNDEQRAHDRTAREFLAQPGKTHDAIIEERDAINARRSAEVAVVASARSIADALDAYVDNKLWGDDVRKYARTRRKEDKRARRDFERLLTKFTRKYDV